MNSIINFFKKSLKIDKMFIKKKRYYSILEQ